MSLKISVVIPALNAASTLPDTLVAVCAQDHLPGAVVEVIVVDDGSEDGTAEVARSFNNVQLVRSQGLGPGGARNRGVEDAAGEILVFLDSDDMPLPGWSAQIAAAFSDAAVGFATWPALVREPDGVRTATWFPDRHGPEGVLSLAGCFAVRRSVFDGVGGYDPALRMGENSDLCVRARAHAGELGLTTKRMPSVTMKISFGKPPAHYDRYRLEAMEHLLSRDAAVYRDDPSKRAKAHAIAAVNAARAEEWRRARGHAWKSFLARKRDARGLARLAATLLPPLGRRYWLAEGRRSRVQ